MQTTRCKLQKRSLREDENAVSPVVGVIMLIAITVVIAAVVAAFAYGIIGGVASAPNAALVVENGRSGETYFKVIHHGGDTITEAFDSVDADNKTVVAWDNLIIKVDGNTIAAGNVTEGGNGDADFSAGEQLNITHALLAGSTITVVFDPTDDVLQRVAVA